MYQKSILIGNIGQEPKFNTIQNGSRVGQFSLATNESYTDKAGEWQTKTEWHQVTIWGGMATRFEGKLSTGDTVLVEGKIENKTWEDSNGNKRSSVQINAVYLRKISSRNNESNTQSSNADRGTVDDIPF